MVCAAWSAGGAFLAAGSADHHVRLYAVRREPGGPRRVLETAVHNDAVDSIAWAHRGLRFVSGSKDGTAALWTLHATQWRHALLLPQSTAADGKRLKVTMVCWDCSDEYVITAVSDNTIRVNTVNRQAGKDVG
ncbi:PH-interacting protein-like [Ostrinia furnacalis]|uniref:PH-interacting protein-like n=1 Tax=Ostrinia furnacalis TaxID=93504 RepID=UPI00103F6BF8|nr:PH-interacting protein-like [Ostrinia furnacalis]